MNLNNISITLAFVLLVQISYCQQNKPSYDYKNCNFQAVGHRGYSDIYPENTLLSIEEAFKRGIKYCEIDSPEHQVLLDYYQFSSNFDTF